MPAGTYLKEEVEKAESVLDIETLVAEALQGRERIELRHE